MPRALDVDGYLTRLSLRREAPSADGLRRLHAAQVERIPYEAIEIQLRRPTTVDPYDAAERILTRHRGGYCFHLNGAFSLLLHALGYDVVWHRAGVQALAEPAPVGAVGNHLALTVHGLPTDAHPAGDWLVDAGLGDALHEPLPLVAGAYQQGPFRYGLEPSVAEPGGWRFEHDPRGTFKGMDFRPARATTADFEERHRYLSTSPESRFVRACSVQRRDAGGVDMLTGCVLQRLDDGPSRPRTLETQREWFEALGNVFDLPLAELTAALRNQLFARVYAAHERWLSTRGTPATR